MTAVVEAESHRYQRWHGALGSGRWTWRAIVTTAVRGAMKNARTRGLVGSGVILALFTCGMFYMLSILETLVGAKEAEPLFEFVRVMLGVDISSVSRLAEIRELLWRGVFFLTIKVQLILVAVVVSRVGPPLISGDLKARALPIYFARPVTPVTYLLGKWIAVAVFIAAAMLIPNLVALAAGTLVTGGLQTWQATADLGLDLLLSGLGVCVLAGTIILALSSMSSDHRYVTVGWLAVCVLLTFVQTVLDKALAVEDTKGILGCVSLRDNVLVLTDWLFGLRQAWAESGFPAQVYEHALVKAVNPSYAAAVVATWVIASVVVCHRRVLRFSRSAANV